MSLPRPSAAQLVGIAVGLSIAGMLAGTALLLSTDHQGVGWLLFVLSFGGWLAAALLALREGWQAGWFDR